MAKMQHCSLLSSLFLQPLGTSPTSCTMLCMGQGRGVLNPQLLPCRSLQAPWASHFYLKATGAPTLQATRRGHTGEERRQPGHS